jgi:hypothetical protein
MDFVGPPIRIRTSRRHHCALVAITSTQAIGLRYRQIRQSSRCSLNTTIPACKLARCIRASHEGPFLLWQRYLALCLVDARERTLLLALTAPRHHIDAWSEMLQNYQLPLVEVDFLDMGSLELHDISQLSELTCHASVDMKCDVPRQPAPIPSGRGTTPSQPCSLEHTKSTRTQHKHHR